VDQLEKIVKLSHAMFRKTFTLDRLPESAPAIIAPDLDDLTWAEGKVPTPHGLIAVRVEQGRLLVDSPIPVIVELPGQAARSLPAGKHEIK
jgi:hypothetical protein